MTTQTIMFDPARLPARDEDGTTMHPDLFLRCWYDGNPEDEAPCRRASFNSMGLDIVDFDADRDDCIGWEPDVPAPVDSRAWRLVAIYDGEDGPTATFVRDLSPTSPILPERSCRKCGCTEARACPGGCSWQEPDLCSACVSA